MASEGGKKGGGGGGRRRKTVAIAGEAEEDGEIEKRKRESRRRVALSTDDRGGIVVGREKRDAGVASGRSTSYRGIPLRIYTLPLPLLLSILAIPPAFPTSTSTSSPARQAVLVVEPKPSDASTRSPRNRR